MLSQEFIRILKGTLFVKNDTHIITITSNSHKARNLDSLYNLISANLTKKNEGNIIFKEESEEKDFKEILENSTSSTILFPDISYELEFGFLNSKRKILQFKNLSKKNQNLSKINQKLIHFF